MSHTSESGLRHARGCEPDEGTTYEHVYDHPDDPTATIRVCRICGSRRVAQEDAYGRALDRKPGGSGEGAA